MLFWAIVCSLLLHVLLAIVIPNIKFDPVKKPEVIEVQLVNKPAPQPVVEPEPVQPQPEQPKPEPIKPKVEPKPITKPAPVIIKDEPAAVQPSAPPPTQTTQTEVIAVAPKADAPAPVVVPAPPPKATGPTQAEIDSGLNRYRDSLWDAVSKYKRYPEIARRRNIQGKVVIEVDVDNTGKLRSKKVLTSSGSDILDSQALEMVEKAVPLPVPPEVLRSGGNFTIRLPVPFKLEEQ